MIKLRNKGLSYIKIGEKFGISKQRVHQIICEYKSPSSIKLSENEKTKNFIKWCEINNVEFKGSMCATIGFITGGREQIRELVRIRDNYTCQLCGREWTSREWVKGRRLDVHHKDYDKEKSRRCDKLEETDNMITLCHKCHLNLPAHKKSMSGKRKKNFIHI